MQRVSIFVDGANMYYAQKRLGWFIDFRKSLSCFTTKLNAGIAEAYYYTACDPSLKSRDSSFHDYLLYSGYTVRLRNIKQIVDESTGEVVEKVDLGIDIVVDLFNTLELYDLVVLMSGDGAYEKAVEALRSKGKKVIIVAHPDMTARELRNVVGINFLDIRDLEPLISRTDRAPELEDCDDPLSSQSPFQNINSSECAG